MSLSFRISVLHVESVLRRNLLLIDKSRLKVLDVLAEELLKEVIDHRLVEEVALRSGFDIEYQTAGALDEIERQLVSASVITTGQSL